MTKKLRVLVCPLDWGLGHATRCIPIVRALLQLNHEVVMASDGDPLRLLKLEFPQLEFVKFPGDNISYGNKGMVLKMLLSVPRILWKIREEHRVLNKIIDEHHIDLVISDNRFGLWSDKVPTVFVTHQIKIQAPVLSGFVNYFNRKYIN
ncbi:MAG: glycosyltransferase, partial [Bacteroidetes bacterium]|nr:glycosyltransferase [Bacteroidota bacterium]